MEEIRCVKCGKLLYKVNFNLQQDSQVEIEIKCPRCGAIHYIDSGEYLKP